MMSNLHDFEEANKTSPIVEAEWTTNGKSAKKPSSWNFMRITLKNKQQFLLHRNDVFKIENFVSRWDFK